MLESFKGIFSYFVFAAIFIVLMSLIFFFGTIKYKKDKVKFLALFTTLDKRKVILISSLVLNFTLVSFFAVATFYYNNFVMYMIVINSIISIVVCRDIHMIFSSIIYNLLSIFSIIIINSVYNYLYFIYYDSLTFILGVIFVIMVIVYELFITFRQLEIIVKKNGGVLNGRKSTKPTK